MPVLSPEEFSLTAFDFLIVGGGTAGLALADRLTKREDNIVGVIEAGTIDTNVPQITIPGMMGSCIAHPTYDWNLFSEPQRFANDRVVAQPRGKGLGGSSLINFLAMARPSKEEFDALEQLGNKGWNWLSMLKYMKKSETTIYPDISSENAESFAMKPEPKFHGTDGPIQKSLPTNLTGLHKIFLETGAELGVAKNYDSNSGRLVGGVTTWASVDPKTSKRSSSKSACFDNSISRANFFVVTDALATKVLLEKQSDGVRAKGVEFTVNGAKMVAKNVKRDIILSAGTFNSSQILELSGIGNPEILTPLGIEVHVDLPTVGENLQDHIKVSTTAEIDDQLDTIDVVFDGGLDEQLALYEKNKGFLASISAPGFFYLPAKKLSAPAEVEHLRVELEKSSVKLLTGNRIPSVRSGLEKQVSLLKNWHESHQQAAAEVIFYTGHLSNRQIQPLPGKRYISLITCLMHPMSRGTVHITSPDPARPPSINPMYFENSFDLEMLSRALKFTLKAYRTGPLGNVFKSHVHPSSELVDGDAASDEDKELRLKNWIKENSDPVWHPVGTCSMLPREDGGVVDANLKVYGTTNLRVVDCSILPMEVSGHIQAVAYAIAEKAADILCGCTEDP